MYSLTGQNKICTSVRIEKQDLNKIKGWFFDYVQSFKNDDMELLENVLLKEKHTVQVCKEILKIGSSLELRQDELNLAETIALLHDIGRFEQYKVYGTFADGKSVNHAELGVEILKRIRVLDDLNKPTKNLILKAVKYHNRASLPENETDECILYSKLLRDADKLDIYRVVTEYYVELQNGKQNKTIELGLPNTPDISVDVCKSLLNKKIVNIRDIKNLNDFKLLQIGWVFDINYSTTFYNVKSRRYLEIIRETLPNTELITDIFNVIYLYLNKNCTRTENYI
jgi:putative nucleotidyltransferase with HDIG domain